ncbi:SRF-type transcription factor (DNA-binding and dimerization domain)-domain-containing protein [Mycena floridula]|nr:SRF-type transcription factor (DNA-binding and dimerization domain)-domain-containing protein [Mycena floridula]
MRKRQRTEAAAAPGHDVPLPGVPVGEDAFITDHDAGDSAGDDDDDDEKPKSDKKAGRRKIKIEFIQDKSRRHITFSKRKAGIMKKAYELSTLTGTQVLLLVVSETGLVYTFTTAKLQPLVTQPEGKNLIQACLNAPNGSLPSSMPVGTPIGRSSGPLSMPGTSPGTNIPGGLSIGQNPGNTIKDDEDVPDEEEVAHTGRAPPGEKRRRRASSTNTGGQAATSPHSPSSAIPPPALSIPPGTSGPASAQPHPSSATTAPAQISLGQSPTSPQPQHSQIPNSSQNYPGSYGGHSSHGAGSQHPHPGQHQQQADGSPMYATPHMMPQGSYNYSSGGQAGQQQQQQQLGGIPAGSQHGHWGAPPQQQRQVQQGQHYGRG